MKTAFWKLKRIKRREAISREAKRKVCLREVKAGVIDYFTAEGIGTAYLFGSLVEENDFYDWSDIDIAIAGPVKKDYFRMLSEIERLLNRDVHLILLEECPFADFIEKSGVRML